MAESGEFERLHQVFCVFFIHERDNLKHVQSLAQKEKENARLRRVINLLASPLDDEGENIQENTAADAAGVEDDGSSVAASDTEDSEIPVAVWDPADRVYRCVDCWGEIDQGVCFSCLREHVRSRLLQTDTTQSDITI